MKVKQMLGTLTTALVTITTQGKDSQVAPMSAQLGTRAGGNPLAIDSQVALTSAQPGTRAGGNPTDTPLQMAIMSAQPGTRAGGNSTAAASASIDLDTEQHVRNIVEHRVSTAHVPALAITDDETDGEEEGRSLANQGSNQHLG